MTQRRLIKFIENIIYIHPPFRPKNRDAPEKQNKSRKQEKGEHFKIFVSNITFKSYKEKKS